MLALYEFVKLTHLLAGAIGLLLVPVPLLVKKGGVVHRRVGKLFVIAMNVAGASGLAMAASWLVAPAVFRSSTDVVSARASGLFLGTIALITLSAIHQLTAATRRKRLPLPQPAWIDRALPIATALAGLVTATTGLALGGALLIAFGALAVFAAIGDLRFSLRPLPTRMAWWYQHMRSAMVAVIATLTAFLVFGGRRWLAGLVPPGWGWLLWIAPAVVLVPLTELWVARWAARFGERRR
ncbi:MAG: hypothetical protein IAG13_36935 [Deltaproteobacteria bacterium]|nr:hypothetical protein [Nannocystaceae bacterium]